VETNNQLIFLDIETIPSDEMPKLEDIKAPGNYSKPEAILKYQTENQLELYKKQALNSMQGRIICIGWSFNGKTEIVSGQDESQIMYIFSDALCELHDEIREPLHFCGWNIGTFDLPWLWRKSIQYNLPELRKLIPKDNRSLYTDLMKAWQSDYKDFVSLDNCAKFLGIKHEGGKGSDVYQWWKDGDMKSIYLHCKQDIETTIEIYRRIYE
jgi:predicted PolB exonuclease-like 3'-5' exonuclease